MCLQDNDTQSFFQPGIVEGNAFDGQPESEGMTEVSFPTSKIRSVCFWRSVMNQTMSPLVFNVVTECSRYEKN